MKRLIRELMGMLVIVILWQSLAFTQTQTAAPEYPDTTYQGLLKQYDNGRKEAAFVRRLARMARQRNDVANATRISAEYIASLQDVYTRDNLQFLHEFTRSAKDRVFDIFYRNGEKVDQIMGIRDYSERVVDAVIAREELNPLADPGGNASQSEPDWAAITLTITRKYDATYADRNVLRSKAVWYWKKQIWPEFIKSALGMVEKYGASQSNLIVNNACWDIFEHSNDKAQLTAAAAWLDPIAKGTEADNPGTLDTYANLLYRAGRAADGIAWEKKAVSIATEKKDGDIKIFQDTLDKMKKGEPTWQAQPGSVDSSAEQSQPGSVDSSADYLNSKLPIDHRVDDLVSRMTLEEKASQVVNNSAAIPRLKVPAYNWWSEALHGVASGEATVFPEPIGMAATFDAPLIHDAAIAIGTEARAKHHEAVRHGIYDDYGVGLDFWAPNLNICRDPRWGRGQETYGEDPYLTARMAVAFVTGMQGDDPKYRRVIATPKHFAVHSGPEPSRHFIDVDVSKHDEEDTYLPAFRAAVVEGKAGSVMCVYNAVNGEPGCANSFLLRDQLRGKWKFEGYVVSDCGAIMDIEGGHHYTNTLAEAAAISMKRGTDLDCNFGARDGGYLEAVKQGLLSESQLDVSVKRLMRARFELGMFDPPEQVEYAKTPFSANDSEPHQQLALKVARESMVLLKNDGILPLNPGLQSIAVVGPLADQIRPLEGNYNGMPSRPITVLEGIRNQFPGAKITFSAGTRFLRTPDPVPSSVLFTDDGKAGLKAEYFRGTDLQGGAALTRIDQQVNFDFVNIDPVTEVGDTNFSVRWTGVVVPQVTGTFQLGVTGDDGYRLWFDEKILVEDWHEHDASTKTVEVKLEKGHRYPVKLEYFQAGGNAIAQLIWNLPEKMALEEAKTADIVVAVVGITSDLEGEEMKVDLPGFKGGDRTSLDLPAQEEELLKSLKATGKPLVVVLMNGSALAVNWAQANANAILEAWYPGEEGGTAVAETLAGVNNPAGRLPVTFYTSVDQLPLFEDYSMRQRTYRYFSGQPLYPFGYGLSYSSFAYSNLKLSARELNAGDTLEVDVDLKNTSPRDGEEVAEVYLTFPDFPGAPIRALRSFARIHLTGGETQHVHVALSPRDLSSVNEVGDRVVARGSYQISVGSGQPGTNAPLTQTQFSIREETKLPE